MSDDVGVIFGSAGSIVATVSGSRGFRSHRSDEARAPDVWVLLAFTAGARARASLLGSVRRMHLSNLDVSVVNRVCWPQSQWPCNGHGPVHVLLRRPTQPRIHFCMVVGSPERSRFVR